MFHFEAPYINSQVDELLLLYKKIILNDKPGIVSFHALEGMGTFLSIRIREQRLKYLSKLSSPLCKWHSLVNLISLCRMNELADLKVTPDN